MLCLHPPDKECEAIRKKVLVLLKRENYIGFHLFSKLLERGWLVLTNTLSLNAEMIATKRAVVRGRYHFEKMPGPNVLEHEVGKGKTSHIC